MPKRQGLSLYEFQQRFATEEQCRDFLEQKRLPDGFVCPWFRIAISSKQQKRYSN